jgi:hypothetical protein
MLEKWPVPCALELPQLLSVGWCRDQKNAFIFGGRICAEFTDLAGNLKFEIKTKY